MSAGDLYHLWTPPTAGLNPIRFGHKAGEGADYEWVSAHGWDSLASNGGSIEGGGFDGAAIAPLWGKQASWTTVADLEGHTLTDGQWADLRDTLMAATVPWLERSTEGTYDAVEGTEPVRTRFARVYDRKVPTDRELLVDRFVDGAIEIMFEACDPYIYLPTITETLDEGEDATFTPTGWVPSRRWRWVVPGPATNPRLTVEIDDYPDQVIRYVGTVNDGQNLVVDSSPHRLLTTVGGPEFNRFSNFDHGTSSQPGVADLILPPGVEITVTYTSGGTPDQPCTFTHRGAQA